MALSGDLRDGGSAHHSTYLLTDWALSHRTALSADLGLYISDRRDALQSQSAFGTGTAYGHLTHGDDWHTEIKLKKVSQGQSTERLPSRFLFGTFCARMDVSYEVN